LKLKFTVYQLILLISLLILLIRFEYIIQVYKLLYFWIQGRQGITSEMSDHFISALLVFLLPAAAMLLKNKLIFLKSILFPSLSLLIILSSSALFAPLITGFNPGFQKNIAITKLLPPLSQKYFLTPFLSGNEGYLALKNNVLKDYDEKLVISDDASIMDNYYSESKVYVFGTDGLGRDIFTRIIYGTRVSLAVGLFAVTISFFIGMIFGFISGYYEGWGGSVINKLTDMFLSFPTIFFVILVLSLFGNSLTSVIIVLGLIGWMPLFKIVRGEVKGLKSRNFFITASSIGIDRKTLLFKEMLPVVVAPVVSSLILLFANIIIAEASLSYLGLGTGIMHSSWGSMINEGQSYMRTAWWLIIIPGLFLIATIISANNVGKRIQLYFNPRIR
jgi:peptide/nickel transport system permease protein